MKREYGMYTWFGYVRSFEEKMRLMRDAGFTTVCTWWGETFAGIDGTRREQVELAKRYGLFIEHAHIPYYGTDALWFDDEKAAEDFIAKAMAGIELAEACEVPTLVIHPYEEHGEQRGSEELFLSRMRRIANHCRAHNVRLAIENLDDTARLIRLADQIIDDNPAAGVCFDSGHANVSNPGDFSMLTHYKDRVFALHLHDNDALDDQHLMPFAQGCNVDWNGFMRALETTGFQGSLMLESCYPFDFAAFDTEDHGEAPEPDTPIEEYLAQSFAACQRIAAC